MHINDAHQLVFVKRSRSPEPHKLLCRVGEQPKLLLVYHRLVGIYRGIFINFDVESFYGQEATRAVLYHKRKPVKLRVTTIVHIEQVARIKKAIKEIADSEFNGKAPTGKDCALRDGNDNVSSKTDKVYEGFEDKFFLSANRALTQGHPMILANTADPATRKPRIIADPSVSLTMDDTALRAYVAAAKRDTAFPQAGDYVNAKISLFSINGKNDKSKNASYGKKICCQPEVLQFRAKGTPFGASKPSADDFEALPEEEAELDEDAALA